MPIFLIGIMLYFSIGFIRNFVEKKYFTNTLLRLYQIIQIVALVHSLLSLFLPLDLIIRIGWVILYFFIIPVIMYSLLYFYRVGYKPVRYLILGWFIIIVGSSFYGLARFGLIGFSTFNIFSLQIATVLDVLLLSFALADRINLLRIEKQFAQKLTILHLEENRKLLEKLNQEQKNTMQAFVDGEEKERRRLATELHDGIGQLLSVVRLNLKSLEAIKRKFNSDDQELVTNLTNLVDEACREVRNISHNLMPTTVIQLGLSLAIEEYCKKINFTKSIKVSFQNINFEERLPIQTETILFRVVQEIINNAIKHARASRIYVQLIKEDDDTLQILIEDNGIGFDIHDTKNKAGLGLNNIASRIEFLKGKLNIDSAPDKGTIYQITLFPEHLF
jgi:signal transduction histidine kinase